MADGLFSDDPSPAEMAAYGRQATAAQESLEFIEHYAQIVRIQQMESGNCDPAFEIEAKASAGDASNQLLYGQLYSAGLCLPKDEAKALEWITKAADQDHPEANRMLGLLYELGIRGVPANASAAATYMAKAANAGDVQAQSKYGKYLLEGKGVPQNPTLAIEWLEKAATAGDDQASVELGSIYAQNDVVPQDLDAAVKWLMSAAERGDVRAQAILGVVLVERKEIIEAHKWFNLASTSDVPELAQFAVEHRTQLEHTMSKAELEKARKLASEWTPPTPKMADQAPPDIALPDYPASLARKVSSQAGIDEIKRLKIPVEKEAFLASIKTNNLGVFILFHRAGASLETVFWPGGLRALYLAVDFGADDVFDYLIANGADINAYGLDNGMSALTRAIGHNRPRMINALLDHGATATQPPEWVNSIDPNPLTGGTPLLYAVMAKSPDTALIKRLLTAGASTSEKYYGGANVLHWVTNPEIFKLLVSYGADPNAIAVPHETVLWRIVTQGKVDIELLKAALASGADPDGIPDHTSPLLFMAWNGNAEAVQALIDARASVDPEYRLHSDVIPGNWDETDKALVKSGGTPLMLAAKKGHAAVCRALVKAGANPQYEISIAGRRVSPMSFAEQSGNPLLLSAMKQ